MSTQTGLVTDNLTVGYDADVVKSVSLFVQPGQVVALIGPNGCGKSTLLKTVTGFLQKRGGVIYLSGRDRASMSLKEVAKSLSVVMTKSVSPELMTCREVIESGRYPYTGLLGRLSGEDIRVVDEAVRMCECTDIADALYTNISDGQKQRVMLARSIAQEPSVLVLDEPTSYLDIRYKVDILTRIKNLTEEKNIAVLMSLHEHEIAMRLSDIVVAIGDGKVLRSGTPDQVFEEDFIRKLYKLGDMDMSLIGGLPGCVRPKTVKRCTGLIMIQGTMSNVGKSLITAGLCRVFAQDGYRVAPFKSQNMANNSYVTDDGFEMGRAQAVQALCAKTTPDVAMNPILLKPDSDHRSQVVVNGKVTANMGAAEYFEYRRHLKDVITDAFNSLKERYDIIVIEGAGSPAEINLKENDIVNMGLADMVASPVLLVGDIDRGGVFAQLIGTLDLLEDEERSRVAGLIINKFRGDLSLFEPGIKMLQEKAKCTVTGVIPYIDINIDDEDSLSERLAARHPRKFDIAVVRFPHISNFTDMNAFYVSDEVSVRYISRPEELWDPDIIILPGTKNTEGDMVWLNDSQLAAYIIGHARRGTVIIGICGGYQMLGRKISSASGSGSYTKGLSLLDVDTIMQPDKIRNTFKGTVTQASGVLTPLRGCGIKGYEIHMGRTEAFGDVSEFTSDGTGFCHDNIYGTYVHGLFDSKEFITGLVASVAESGQKEVDCSVFTDYESFREEQYDRLADVIRSSLDIDGIYKLMGIGQE